MPRPLPAWHGQPCSVIECDRVCFGKALCQSHWRRLFLYGDPLGYPVPRDATTRFWDKVVKGDGCWEWRGAHNPNGYGVSRWEGRQTSSHRVSWELHNGPIPDGLTIDHLCRNRGCVNPDHLDAVSTRTNVLRGVGPTAVNAVKTHCPQGHEYTEANTVIRRANGWRECRECAYASARRWKARQGVAA